MHFPIVPIFMVNQPSESTIWWNIILSAAFALLLMVGGILSLIVGSKGSEDQLTFARLGFILLVIAAIVATLGTENTMDLMLLGIGLWVIIYWIFWKLIGELFIWRFLVKRVFWNALPKAWIAITSKK